MYSKKKSRKNTDIHMPLITSCILNCVVTKQDLELENRFTEKTNNR